MDSAVDITRGRVLRELLHIFHKDGLVLFEADQFVGSNSALGDLLEDPEELIDYCGSLLGSSSHAESKIVRLELYRKLGGSDIAEEMRVLKLDKVMLQIVPIRADRQHTLFVISEDHSAYREEYLNLKYISETVDKGLGLFVEDPLTGRSRAKYVNQKYSEITGVPIETLYREGTVSVRARVDPSDREVADTVCSDSVMRDVPCDWPVRILSATGSEYKWMRFHLHSRRLPSGELLLLKCIENFNDMARMSGMDHTPDIAELDSPRRGRRLLPSIRIDDGELSSGTTTIPSHSSDDEDGMLSIRVPVGGDEEYVTKEFVIELISDRTFFMDDVDSIRDALLLDFPPLFRKIFSRQNDTKTVLQILSQHIGAPSADWLETGGPVSGGFHRDLVVDYVIPFLFRRVVSHRDEFESLAGIVWTRVHDLEPILGCTLTDTFKSQFAIMVLSIDRDWQPVVEYIERDIAKPLPRGVFERIQHMFMRALYCRKKLPERHLAHEKLSAEIATFISSCPSVLGLENLFTKETLI